MHTLITGFLLASTRGQGLSPPVPIARANARANSRATSACPSDGFCLNVDNCIALGLEKVQQATTKLLSAPTTKTERAFTGASPARWNTMIGERLADFVMQYPTHEFITGDEVRFPISTAVDEDECCAQDLEKENITKTFHVLSNSHAWDVAAAMLIMQNPGDLIRTANLSDLIKPLDIMLGRVLCASKAKLPKRCTSTNDGGRDEGNKTYRTPGKRATKYLIELKKVPSEAALKPVVSRSAKESDIVIRRPKPRSRDSPSEDSKKCDKGKKRPNDVRCPTQSGNDPSLPGSEF